MPGQQPDLKRLNDANIRALEYVTGTLRDPQREAFTRELPNNAALRWSVSFWEEQLCGLQDTQDTRPPAARTWATIAARLNATPGIADSARSRRDLLTWLPWGLSGTVSLLLLYTLGPGRLPTPLIPAADYIAVLTDSDGSARLTALTAGDSRTLWLQWGEVAADVDRALQLWAISRSDGETRPIAVLETTAVRHLVLSAANRRLLRDAAFLILSEESSGDLTLDEPGNRVLARGECVRFPAGTNPS